MLKNVQDETNQEPVDEIGTFGECTKRRLDEKCFLTVELTLVREEEPVKTDRLSRIINSSCVEVKPQIQKTEELVNRQYQKCTKNQYKYQKPLNPLGPI